MSNVVTVRNLDELAKALHDHALDVQAGLGAVAQAGAEVYRQAAAERAPVRTGRLAESVVVGEVEMEGWTAVVPVGPSAESHRSFIGRFQEYGTVHQPAQPWMRPAGDESVDRIVAASKRAASALLP